MTDSTYFLASEYKLGGYRFDLMGLHTVEAMNALSSKLREDYREDIIIYGEPWDMSSTAMSVTMPLASYQNIDDTNQVGGFSDQIRDAARGGVFKSTDAGFVQVGADKIDVQMKNRLSFALLGKVFSGTNDPTKTINYVSCHDNNTLYDKIRLAGESYGYDEARLRQQAVQAQSFVLLGQGVSFLHAGSEMLRSKPFGDGKYDHNSYMSSYEVNSLKWDEKIDNLDIFTTYQAMIALKRDNAAFQYATRQEIDDNVSVEFGSDFDMADTLIKMTVESEDKTYVVVFLGSAPRTKVNLDGMEVLIDTTATLEPGTVIEGEYTMSANTTLVLDANPTAEGGGLSTGAIIGISVGSAAGVGAIAVLLFFLLKRKKVV
jgi:pullulanase